MAAEALVGLLILFLILLFIAVIIASVAFWIWMIIDCAQRKMKDNDKVVWILIIVFLHWIGATVYYFVVKRKSKN